MTYLTRRVRTYAPDAEDWIWYTILPFVAYGGLVVAAILLRAHPVEVLFGIAGCALLLIFVGIHNAWDVVTFIVSGQLAAP